MSRVGKKPIDIPSGVKVDIGDSEVTVEGPKGKLSTRIMEGVRAEVSGSQLLAHRDSDEKSHRALHGLFRALLANTVTGVSKGFSKQLDVVGVGYKVDVKGPFLKLSLGYSHPILVPIPDGIEMKVDRVKKPISQYVATISISGADKGVVGQIAADIRKLRKPDPYKGKGLRYVGELVKTKVGKKGA